ncbi:hypothetical protein ACFU44_14060 [Nocardia rhizosphaerihabitans]|uniref:hypothetical protein n=1 Tax=Nocardia rhizosphaerihabitans TaxID=1691570 RepID=UPI003671AC92
MNDQHPLEHAPGIARVLAMLMLLAGIVAMHSAVFGTAHASTAESSHATNAASPHPSTTDSSHASTAASSRAMASDSSHASTAASSNAMTGEPSHASPAAHDAPAGGGPIHFSDPATDIVLAAAPAEDKHGTDTGCGAAGCGEHAAVHSCVFVLAALAVALTLVLLYRLTNDTAAIGHATARPWRGRRERPPPWTVLSLAQLAILRI